MIHNDHLIILYLCISVFYQIHPINPRKSRMNGEAHSNWNRIEWLCPPHTHKYPYYHFSQSNRNPHNPNHPNYSWWRNHEQDDTQQAPPHDLESDYSLLKVYPSYKMPCWMMLKQQQLLVSSIEFKEVYYNSHLEQWIET